MKMQITRTICALLAVLAVAACGSRASALDYDATFGAGNDAAIARVMLEGLLDESARIIKEAYGIDGRSNNKLAVMWDDDPLSPERLGDGTLAVAGGHFGIPYDTMLIVNSSLFRDTNAMNVADGRTALCLTVLHELTHGMQFTSSPGLISFIAEDPTRRSIGKAQFLYEGMAEYVADGNSRTLGYAQNRRKAVPAITNEQIAQEILTNMTLAMSTVPGAGGYSTSAEQTLFYIGSYLATRWFDTESKRKGGSGAKGLIQYLEAHGNAQGENSYVLDAAIRTASGGRWSEYAVFANSTIGMQNSPTSDFYKFVLDVVKEDAAVDAGRIGGYYASGGTRQTRDAVASSLSGKPVNETPLAAYGFTEVTIFGKKIGGGSTTPPSGGSGSGGGGGGGGGGSQTTPPSSGGGGGGGSPSAPPSGGGSSTPPPVVDSTVHTGQHNAAVQGGTPDAVGRRTITFTPTATTRTLAIKIDVDLSKFVGVTVGGRALTRGQDYTATEGSTVITFTEAYLATLAAGTPHAVSVKFSDGGTVGTAEFNVIKTAGTQPPAPSMQPNSGGGSGGGCVVGAGAVLAAALVASRRMKRS